MIGSAASSSSTPKTNPRFDPRTTRLPGAQDFLAGIELIRGTGAFWAAGAPGRAARPARARIKDERIFMGVAVVRGWLNRAGHTLPWVPRGRAISLADATVIRPGSYF